jgi:hypothetical protein
VARRKATRRFHALFASAKSGQATPDEPGVRNNTSVRATVLLLTAITAAAAEPGHFTLRVSATQPARYYLTDSSGKHWDPPGAIIYSQRTEHHFITANGFAIELPAGRYSLIAERGLEHRPLHFRIVGHPARAVELNIHPSRWVDMNRRRWYSGDLHNHRPIADMPLLLQAEALNLAPTLADWVWDDRERTTAPDTVEPVRSIDSTHVYSVLDKEIERLKAGPGAVDLVGLRSRIPFDGYLLHPTNEVFAKLAHAQGAWVDAEKIVWRDVAALVALGHIDFAGIVYNHFNRQDVEIETDSWGMIPKWRPEFKTPEGMPLWAMEVYYRFLNCGFRLAVSAGSASGVKAAPLGYNRVYVKLDTPFSYDAWFRALKTGRSFATNGPILSLTVDGAEPGGVVRIPPGGRRTVRIRAEAQSLNPLNRIEVLFKGRVIRTAQGAGRLALNFSFDVREGGWFAARAFERPDHTVRFAHTSPVYIEAGEDRGTVPEDAQFLLAWIDREMAFYRSLPGFREPAHREAMLDLFQRAREIYAALAAR